MLCSFFLKHTVLLVAFRSSLLLASGSGCFHPVFFCSICCPPPVACRFPRNIRKPSIHLGDVSCLWSCVECRTLSLLAGDAFRCLLLASKQWCWTGLMRPCPYQASVSVVKVLIRLLGKEASIKTSIQSLAICLWPFLYFQERALSRCGSAAPRHCWQGMTEALIELNRHAQWSNFSS